MALEALKQVDWSSFKPWLLPAAGALAATYSLYRLVRVARADCDLSLLDKRLKPGYFTDRVVWVTGASSGIGEALCYELSKHGAKLIMSARSEQKMEAIRQNLHNPENAKILSLDLSDADVCGSATEKALQLFGRVDILINNAGVSQRCYILDMDEKTHRTMMQLNFNSPRTLTRDLLPGMIAQDFGHIVNITSIYGKCGAPVRSTYCSTKFALHGLTNALRYEFHDKKNLHFTLICPGPVKTLADRNALMGDGRIYGQGDTYLQKGMAVERCAQLTLIAISNQQFEAWVSDWSGLYLPYLAHYAQSLLHYVWRRRCPGFLQAATGRPGY